MENTTKTLDDRDGTLFLGWFEDTNNFRRLMHKYNALISGSTVLRMLLGKYNRGAYLAYKWTPSDMDIYVAKHALEDKGLLDFHVYFTKQEKLQLQTDEETDHNYPFADVSTEQQKRKDAHLKIQS